MKPRRGKNSNRFVSVRGYPGILILLSAPFLLGAGEYDRPAIEENRQQIQNMTSAQQAKLKRNFAEFQKLSVKDQNVIRKLHQRLEEDTHNGGNLRELMWVYKEWLKTLSPWDREKLLKEKDPAARLVLVQEFKKKQENEEWEKTLTFTERRKLRGVTGEAREKMIREFKRVQETRPSRSSVDFSRWRHHQIPSEEFGKIMELVESNTKIPAEVQDRFSSITIAERHLLVLLTALKQHRNGMPSATERKQNRESPNVSPVPWPDDMLMKKIANAISDSNFQDRFQSYGNDKELRRRFLFFRINNSFLSEWRDHHKPSDKELQAFFKELDQSEKDNLLRRSGSEHCRRLKILYYFHQERQSKFHDEFSEFRDITSRYYRFGPRGGSRSRGVRGSGARGRNRGGPSGGFGSGKRPPFPQGNKDFRKGPPRG